MLVSKRLGNALKRVLFMRNTSRFDSSRSDKSLLNSIFYTYIIITEHHNFQRRLTSAEAAANKILLF